MAIGVGRGSSFLEGGARGASLKPCEVGSVRVSVRAKVRELALDEERGSFERGFGSSSATTVRLGRDCH